MDSYKDLRAMVNKNKRKKKKKNFNTYGKNSKELNNLIEKKFQKFFKNKKRRKTEKELNHFKEMQFSNDKAKRGTPARQKAWKVENFLSSSAE